MKPAPLSAPGCPAALRRTVIALAVLGAVAAWALAPVHAGGVARRKGPYLATTGDPTTMEVLWQLDDTVRCTLEWGHDTEYGLGSVMTAERGDHQHSFVIRGLAAGTVYRYRVTMDGQPYTGSFRTPPPPDARSVKLVAYGDTRSQPWVHDRVAAAIVGDMNRDPGLRTLVLGVGDLVSRGREESAWDEQFFDTGSPHIQELLASAPYWSCIGNHDLKGAGDDLFLKYFPGGWTAPHYGALDYGPLHVVFVDQYADLSPGSAQYTWLAADLAATRKPWRFVVLHEPGWSAGPHPDNLAVQRDLQPLFEAHRVSLVIAGHNHYYARAMVNGIAHITTGGGGAPLYNPDPAAPAVVAASKSYHYCRIALGPGSLELEAVTPEGTVIDSFRTARRRARGAVRRARPRQDHAPR